MTGVPAVCSSGVGAVRRLSLRWTAVTGTDSSATAGSRKLKPAGRAGRSSSVRALRILADAGFLTGKKIRQWVFYKRDDKALAAFKSLLQRQI